MAKPVLFALGFCAIILTVTQALRDLRINVPLAVIHEDDAILDCYYDLEGDQLYAVKWYLGNTEFYRYTPKENPPIKQFRSTSGLTVREHYSNATRVVLEHVPMTISGRYSCEVSADAPSFFTSMQSAYLQVVKLPTADPYITGVKTRYHHGDILRANCTSEHSNPPANLTWYINGMPAEPGHVHDYLERSTDGQFFTQSSVLRLRISKQLFQKHRLKIRCVASMYDIYYRSHEKSVEAEKKRHHHGHSITTAEPPAQWGLAQAAGAHPEATLVFKSAPPNERSGNSARAPSLLLIAGLVLLR